MTLHAKMAGVSFFDGRTTLRYANPDFVREKLDRRHARVMLCDAFLAWCFLSKEPLGRDEIMEMMGIRNRESEAARLFALEAAVLSSRAEMIRNAARSRVPK